MGNFYTNTTIKNIARSSILSLLRRYERECYVSPEFDGFTTIYDIECDELGQRALRRLAAMVSETLNADVITFANYDDDILAFKIYEDGIIIADYEIKPDHFDSELELDLTLEQNAVIITHIFGNNSDCLQTVMEILKQDFCMAIELHEGLLKALCMPTLSVGYGYNDLSQGDIPLNCTINDFEHIQGGRRFFP